MDPSSRSPPAFCFVMAAMAPPVPAVAEGCGLFAGTLGSQRFDPRMHAYSQVAENSTFTVTRAYEDTGKLPTMRSAGFATAHPK